MRVFLRRLLLVALLLGGLVLALTGNVQAQSSERSQGGRGPISREELRARLERLEVIDGYIIQGDDVIALIRETTVAIVLRNAIIEGGLDFTTLPAISPG